MDPLEALPVGVSPAKEGGSDISDFGDVFGAAFENMFVADQSTSREYNTIQARGALFKEAAEAVGMSVTDWRKMIYAQEIPELAQIGPTKLAEDMASRNMPMQDLVRIDRWRRNLPAEVRAKVPDPNDFDLYSKRLALETYFRNEGIISSASGFDRTVGSFTGGTAGSMFDPINLGSMAIFRRPSTSIVGGLTYGAATSGATELILQPFVQQYREELGLPSGWDEGLQNVLFATIGGGAFGGIEGGVSKLGEYLSTRLAKGVATDTERDLYDLVSRRQNGDIDEAEFFTELQSLRSQDDALDAALSISERAEAARDVDESNPFGSVPDADELHRARFQSPELADLEAVDAPLVDGSFIMSDPRLRELGIEAVDFRTLLRDPERFQFKASDEDGLTGALSDVTAWEPERAGLLLVWEDEAGQRFIVNGHQRHGLAGRLMDNGHEPIFGPAMILREVDGITADAAMVRGALINIAEGSGTSLDAARILRIDPSISTTLPPNSALVREAGGLSRLSDDAFGMVINEVAEARWGAVIGREIDDPQLHAGMLSALQRLNPRNLGEAESMARDLSSVPVQEAVTADLFGEVSVRIPLIAERARVRQAALTRLRNDQRTFRTINRNQARLEAEGNALDEGRNRVIENRSALLADRLERESHLRGDISNALNSAAEEFANGGSLEQSVSRLIDAIERRSEAGSPGSATDAPGRGGDDATSRNQSNPAETELATDPQTVPELRQVARDELGEDVADVVTRVAEMPRSLQAARNLSPEDRRQLLAAHTDEEGSSDRRYVHFASRPGGVQDSSIVISRNLYNSGVGWNVYLELNGSYSSGGSGNSARDVATATRMFAQAIVYLSALIERDSPTIIRFSGATPAHTRLYASLLSRIEIPGYAAYEEARYIVHAPDWEPSRERSGQFLILPDGHDVSEFSADGPIVSRMFESEEPYVKRQEYFEPLGGRQAGSTDQGASGGSGDPGGSQRADSGDRGRVDPDQPDLFSRGRVGAGVAASRVADVLRSTFGDRAQGLMSAGRLVVHETADGLNIADDVVALFRDGRITLIADRMDEARIASVFLHEAGVHGGMRGYLGEKAWLRFQDDVAQRLERGDPDLVAARRRVPEDTPEAHIIEETIGYWIEEGYAPQARLREFFNKLRASVYQRFPVFRGLVKLDNSLVQQIAIQSLRSWSRSPIELTLTGPRSVRPDLAEPVMQRVRRGTITRDAFVDEVRSLKPDADEAFLDRAWRYHEMYRGMLSEVPTALPEIARNDAAADFNMVDDTADYGDPVGAVGSGRELLHELDIDPEMEVMDPDTGALVRASEFVGDLDRDTFALNRLQACVVA